MEGAHHDWFEEGRSPMYFDGVTSDPKEKVFGRFYAYEGTIPMMDSSEVSSERQVTAERVSGQT